MTFIVAATVSWFAFLWVIYRARTTDATTVRTWAFVALFGAATTVQIEPVYMQIGLLSGINNLAWLLSYCLGAAAVYMVVVALHDGLKIGEEPVVLRRALYGSLLALLLIFPAIARQPNQPDHVNPSTTAELSFMLALYLFGVCACFTISRTFFRLCQQDTVLHSRLRWLVIVVAAFSAGLYFACRITYAALVFRRPDLVSQPLVMLLEVFYIAAFFGCLGWIFFFLPTSVFQTLARPVLAIDKLLALHELGVLLNLISLFYPPIAPPILHQTWLQRLQNLDFHLYRTIIVILDGKRALIAHYTDANGQRPEPVARLRHEPLVARAELARNLYLTMSQVSDDAPYWDLVDAYREVGRLYRRGAR